jgi:hypothetical protein
MKAVMLFFFQRLTLNLWHARLVTFLAIACGVSYLIVFLTVTFGCFPIAENWQVDPKPSLACSLKKQNFVVTVVFNVLTDFGILCVPIPLLWGLKVPMRKKLVIGVLLSSGAFVIAAAIVRVALTLGNSPSALNINRWGVRETIVGIVTINVPVLRPLFTRLFWTPGDFKSRAVTARKAGYKISSSGQNGDGVSLSRSGDRDTFGKWTSHSWARSGNNMGDDGSEEYVLQERPSQVIVKTTYGVSTEHKGETASDQYELGVKGRNLAIVKSGDDVKLVKDGSNNV